MRRIVHQKTAWLVCGAVLIGAVALGPTVVERMAYAAAKGEVRARREQLAEMSKLDHLSPLFRTVVEVVQPAVVEIRVTKRLRAPAMPDLDEFFQRFFGDDSPFGRGPGPQRRRPEFYFSRGVGSGVIVDAKNGYVITNYHVVAEADEVEVILDDERQAKAEWVRSDPQTDLAVIKIATDGLIDAPLGDSDQTSVGDWVLAIGSPRGLQQTVTAGIVSAKGRQVGGAGTYQDAIQTDAAINRGNSGGPLVNTRGEVIGINNAIASFSGGNEGIGFAIPSNMIRDVMTQLIEKGKVVRGYLGVVIQDVTPKLAESFSLPSTKGALVSQVQDDGPAGKAGAQVGDFIISVSGKAVDSVKALRHVIAAIAPDTTVAVEVIRNGETVELQVTLAAQPIALAGGPAVRKDQPSKRYGLAVEPLTKDVARRLGFRKPLAGVVVTQIDPASEAAREGLTSGMVITHVDGEAVATADAFAEALQSAKSGQAVRLRVCTPKDQRFVMIEPLPGDEADK
ncbi:MAG: Do family serine endopeptidase [Planctomycetota bacterium]